MGANLQSIDGALKEYYTNDRVDNMVFDDQPILAMMGKDENFGGKHLVVPLIYANPQGRSATFQQAQKRGNLTNTKLEDFIIKRVKDYAIATIDNETLEASKGDKYAFMDAATMEIDGSINALKNSIAQKIWGNGAGSIGQVGTIVGNTITLGIKQAIVNFEVGMEIVGAATELSGAIRTLGSNANGLFIMTVDRIDGSFTVLGNVTDSSTGIPSLTGGDYLFVRGDRNEAGGTSLVISGIPAWVPMLNPTSTLFNGVDRTQDVTRLGGLRIDVSNKPIEEGLTDALLLASMHGAKVDHLFMSFFDFGSLEKALGTRVHYIDVRVNATIGFRGVEVMGPKGPVKVIPDRNLLPGQCWGLQMNTWKLRSLGKAWRPLDTDGLTMLRQGTADGVEVRYGGYMNVSCSAPGYNIAIKLA